MKWWERYPGRLEREIERLRARGFTTTFDPATVKGDVVEVAVSYPFDGRQYDLRIVFPYLYPYFRPHVFAAGLAIPHHQNPLDHSLCLLGRNTDWWDPSHYIADVIAEQLPKLLASEEIARAGGRPEEELQAEPWIEYLGPHPEFQVAWNSDINVPTGAAGRVELTHIHRTPTFRGYVSRVMSDGKPIFKETESPVPDATASIWIPFIRLDTPPPATGPDLVTAIRQKLPRFNPQGEIKQLAKHTRGSLLAMFYPEETSHRKAAGIGLVLVLFTQQQTSYVRTHRVGGSSLTARLGEYGSIRKHKILLVGFGSLGSAVAVGLCKLGVAEITIVDRDVLEPGNTVRHALGMQFFGMDKAVGAVEALKGAYPYTKVRAVPYRLGEAGQESAKSTREFLAALEGSDVIVDCSAERAVQQYLSDEAWRLGKRYFFLEAYPGLLGGFIGCVAPGAGPCYLCFLNALEKHEIARPPIPERASVQPAGCGEPTFVGTPFDADTLAAAGLRLIFGTLAKGANYPAPASPYYRAVFASDDLSRSQVLIEPIDVRKKDGCPVCSGP